MLGKRPQRGVDETDVKQLAASLLGKELTMRYAQRESSGAPAHAAAQTPEDDEDSSDDQDGAGASYSVISRELKLKIVGVADLDPESMRGPTRARVFLPA